MISPIPGPTFDIAEADADTAVKKSKPKRLKETEVKMNSKMYMKKKLIIDV